MADSTLEIISTVIPSLSPQRRTSVTSSTAEGQGSLQSPGNIAVCIRPGWDVRYSTLIWTEILMALLNDGTSPTTNRQILRKETVDAMFQNQIPEFPNCGRNCFHAAKPDIVNAVADIYPNGGQPQGWGLTFMLTGGLTGRSEATAWWGGLPNLYWWCDREKGIGGMFCTQILPFSDSQAFGLWADLETTVYQAMI